MTAIFNAVKDQKPSMTVAELGKYLCQYIDAQFPINGIAYWNNVDSFKDKLASYNTKRGFHHVAAYVGNGRLEMETIYVGLVLGDGRTQDIGYAKSLGGTTENWAISRAISEVIESLYLFQKLPLLVDMAAALPVTPRRIKSSGTYTIELLRTDYSLAIIFNGDAEVARYDARSEDDNGRRYIDDLVSDWEGLAKNCDMRIINANDRL